MGSFLREFISLQFIDVAPFSPKNLLRGSLTWSCSLGKLFGESVLTWHHYHECDVLTWQHSREKRSSHLRGIILVRNLFGNGIAWHHSREKVICSHGTIIARNVLPPCGIVLARNLFGEGMLMWHHLCEKHFLLLMWHNSRKKCNWWCGTFFMRKPCMTWHHSSENRSYCWHRSFLARSILAAARGSFLVRSTMAMMWRGMVLMRSSSHVFSRTGIFLLLLPPVSRK